jgi:myo-inositol-1(or 4)-monophosphatase
MPERVLSMVRETRGMLSPFWGNVEASTKVGSDGHTSAVTELDRKIETHLKEALRTIDPGAGFAGEEFGGSREQERFWLCDPIDGTMQFIRGMPGCTVMLALVENGAVTFSVIYDFMNDIMYHARRGHGAFKEHEAIRVSTRSLPNAYIAFQARMDKPGNLERRSCLRSVTKLFNPNISGYEFILAATGKLDGRIVLDENAKDWDNAPGTLLVEEAGGIVANIGSHSYDFRNTNYIAANPAVYRALTEGPNAIFPITS